MPFEEAQCTADFGELHSLKTGIQIWRFLLNLSHQIRFSHSFAVATVVFLISIMQSLYTRTNQTQKIEKEKRNPTNFHYSHRFSREGRADEINQKGLGGMRKRPRTSKPISEK